MLDIGWTELLVIAVVLIVVVGPKDLPPMLRAFGKMTSNLRKMAGDFRTQFDQALREADMDDVRQTISDAQRFNPANALREAMNPLREMGNEIRNDLQKATEVPKPADDAEGTDVTSVEDLIPAPTMSLAETPPIVPVTPDQPAASAATAPAAASAATPSQTTPAANAPATSAPAGNPAAVSPAAVKKPRAPRKTAVQVVEAPILDATTKPLPPKPRRATKPAAQAVAAEPAADQPPAPKPVARARKKPTTPKDEA
jgi:sec-independent protein translocase protein TatB